MMRDRAIIEFHEQVRKLTKELELVTGSTPQNPYCQGYDVNPVDIAYSSSHEDFDDEEEGARRRRHPRDDLRALKVEALKFDDNLNLKNYLDWIQAIKKIFELKEYNDEKSFMLVILKLKECASLWYGHMKKSGAREAKSKIKTWSKLKKHMDKKFLPPSYKQELYLKVNSLNQENLKVEGHIRECEQLQMSIGLDEESELKIARVIKGLSPSIAYQVNLQPYLSFIDICHLVIKVKKQLKGQKPF